MAQGIFFSLQFLACIRLMKVIFFPNMKNPFACLYLSEPFRQKSPFQCTGCISVSEGRCEGLLKNPCWGTMSLSIFQHVVEEKKPSYLSQPRGHTYRTAPSCYGGDLGLPVGLDLCNTSESIILWLLSQCLSEAIRPIFTFLIKARIHQFFVIFSSVFQ